MPLRLERRIELKGDVETLDGKPLASGVTLRIDLWRSWAEGWLDDMQRFGEIPGSDSWEWKGTIGGCESGEMAIGHHMRFRAPDDRTGNFFISVVHPGHRLPPEFKGSGEPPFAMLPEHSAPEPVEVKGSTDAST